MKWRSSMICPKCGSVNVHLKDKETLAREWAPMIEALNARKNKWEQAAKKSEDTYDFLKRHIYV